MMIKHTLSEAEIVLACREWLEQRVSIEGDVETTFECEGRVLAGKGGDRLTLTFTSKIETYRG